MHPIQKGVKQTAITLIKKKFKKLEREGGIGKGSSP